MISLSMAMRDPMLLGSAFQPPTFWPWLTLAKVIGGEKLDKRELALFRQCTGRSKPPRKPVTRLDVLAGRRAGKDRFFSGLAVYRAALAADWQSILSPGEQGVVMLIGTDKKQARILRSYCDGLLQAPLLAAEVDRDTGETIEFKSGASLEVVVNDARLVRGRSAIAIIGTEAAFWRANDESMSSDEEVYASAEPALAMCPDGGMMVLSSSVYRKRGLLYRRWKEFFGRDESDDLIWLASSRVMNPALPQSVVDKAMERDPSRARAEYLSSWREDVADFIPADVVDGATDWKIVERPPEPGIRYHAYCDAAGGTGADSFTIGISHVAADGSLVLDALRERRPRFVPASVVAEFAELLASYRVTECRGDKYAAGWASDEWTRQGIRYVPSERTTSEVYLAGLPLMLSGRARLLDSERLRQQLTGLERRVLPGGRENVDHGPNSHDDVAASAIGAIVAAADAARRPMFNNLAGGAEIINVAGPAPQFWAGV